jgi:branched-chain amino acid transport system substrate-binding protein
MWGTCALLVALLVILAAGPAAAVPPGRYQLGFLVAGGPLGIESASFLAGARLAVARIATSEYLPGAVRLSLRVEGVADDTASAAAAFNRLAADPRVLAAACCIREATAAALAGLAPRRGLPLVLFGAGGGGLARLPWVYSMAGWPGADEPGIVRRLARGMKIRNAGFFAPSDDAGLRRRAEAVRAALEHTGVPSFGLFQAPAAAPDLAVPAAAIAAASPDMLFVFASASATGTLIAALRARGWTGYIAATDAIAPAALQHRLGAVLADIPFATDFSEVATPAATHFARAFQAVTGDLPDPYAARGYETVWLVAQALRGLPDSGEADIRAALASAMARIGTLDLNLYGGETMRDGQLQVRARRLVMWTTTAGLTGWWPIGAAE